MEKKSSPDAALFDKGNHKFVIGDGLEQNVCPLLQLVEVDVGWEKIMIKRLYDYDRL